MYILLNKHGPTNDWRTRQIKPIIYILFEEKIGKMYYYTRINLKNTFATNSIENIKIIIGCVFSLNNVQFIGLVFILCALNAIRSTQNWSNSANIVGTVVIVLLYIKHLYASFPFRPQNCCPSYSFVSVTATVRIRKSASPLHVSLGGFISPTIGPGGKLCSRANQVFLNLCLYKLERFSLERLKEPESS